MIKSVFGNFMLISLLAIGVPSVAGENLNLKDLYLILKKKVTLVMMGNG